jgi:hypothetical protein
MLCSHCSREVKPVVAIDIDGTLGNYHLHFLDFACRYLGWGGLEKLQLTAHYVHYNGTRKFGEWFCEMLGVDMTTFRQIKLAYRQGGMKRTMPVDPEARAMIVQLRERAEVWLTTTRPYLRLDNVDPDTRFWLERNGIASDGILYDEEKYHQLATLIDPARVVAVLDDEAEQYSAAVTAFGAGAAILKHNGYNDGVIAQRTVARSLYEACSLIETRIDEWEKAHA